MLIMIQPICFPPHLHFTKSHQGHFSIQYDWRYSHFTSKSFEFFLVQTSIHLLSSTLLLSPSHFASNVLSIWSTKGDSIVPVQISNQSWSFSVEPSQLFQQKTLEVLAKWFLTLTNAFLTFQNIVTSNSAKIVRSCRAKDPQRRQTKQMICTVKKCIQKSSQTFYLYGISHLVIQFSDLLFVGFFVVW